MLEFGTASHREYVDQKIETSVESYVKKRHFVYSVFEFFLIINARDFQRTLLFRSTRRWDLMKTYI